MYDKITCRAEGFTLTHIKAPPKEMYPGHIAERVAYLNEEILRLAWEKIPESTWNIFLPEAVGSLDSEGKSQVDHVFGMQWQAASDRLFFDWLSLAPKLPMEVRCEIAIESGTALMYTVELRNSSRRTIENVTCANCFNHHQTEGFGRELFVFKNGALVGLDIARHPKLQAPGLGVVTSPLFRKMRHTGGPEVSCERGIIATSARAGGKGFTLAHCSPDASTVWSNQMWPCTDLYIAFCDVEPGKTKRVQARLYFLDGYRALDEVGRRFEADSW